jgi:hypothetical protein
MCRILSFQVIGRLLNNIYNLTMHETEIHCTDKVCIVKGKTVFLATVLEN